MRLGSRRVAAVAFGLAAALHLGGVMGLDLTEDVLIEGGQVGAAEASLGDGFADLAQGTLSGVEATEMTEPVPVEDMAEQVPPPEASQQPVAPEGVTAVQPPDDTMQPDPALSVTDMAPVPQPTLRVVPRATDQPNAPVPPTEQAIAPPPDTLTAEEPDQMEVTQSLRPQVRSREFEERNKPDDPPPAPQETTRTATRTQAVPSQRGNQAQTNARAGQTDGTAAAPAQRATGQGATQAGNAAASNYPGQVMRRIQRVRRPRVSAQGAATVAFRVASNGGLSTVSVARSSGSAELDRAAMQVIQRAAPFPAPPQGARRSFSIQIQGR
ncbi:TonB family protein [Tateyamaria omphalii]|uniref:cell envelope integrity protein TolA n=1 Tax=Tateyamaria omphalii TaxID=299262 RepID=UPI001C98F4F3|nr:energy transducer TonB [Tateyamaria omphalii]MBY5935646.1 TonB family protein [Tateyamaria omphalii]